MPNLRVLIERGARLAEQERSAGNACTEHPYHWLSCRLPLVVYMLTLAQTACQHCGVLSFARDAWGGHASHAVPPPAQALPYVGQTRNV